MKRSHFVLAVLLAVATTLLLALGHRQVGYVRDEGIYFEASRRYAAWAQQLVEAPSKALRRRSIEQHFGFNREHPPTMKLAAGVSARLFAHPPAAGKPGEAGLVPVMPEGAAMRLPAQVLAGVGVALSFLVGASLAGTTGGLLAAGSFILLPRVWFHAGLHAFDVPIAVMVFALVLAYRQALRDWRYGLLLGPLWGLAITIKHNALFVLPLLAVHYAALVLWSRWRHGVPLRGRALVPWPFVSLAVLGPATAFALWPWLWHRPVAKLAEYVAFHRDHAYYNMEFLGTNYNQPPLPVAYPFVMTWATVPSTLLVLALLGLGIAIVRDCRRGADLHQRGFWTPCADGSPRQSGLLLLIFTAFPLVLIALPEVPIFGGTKHFITAYPFMAVACVVGWRCAWEAAKLPPRVRRWSSVALALVLGPALVATATGHPYNLSQYAPLAGGARGAADLGLNRGFWGHAMLPFVEALEGKVYAHDLHPLSIEQLRREGRWPARVQTVGVQRADQALLFHELHMQSDEISIWNELETTAPTANVTLHDVPLTSLYEAAAR